MFEIPSETMFDFYLLGTVTYV